MQTKKVDTKKLVTMAMLAAVAYIIMLLAHLVPVFAFMPAVPFLKYDPKDVIIAIGGFMLGPLPALAISAVVSIVEMVTISSTGIIGCIMNILSSAAFSCTAALIYKKKHDMFGAVVGLIAGCLLTTAVMMLWNYLITPLYMDVGRDIIVKLLLPAFMPFNLIKTAANMALALLIYKPVVGALRKAGLMPKPVAQGDAPAKKKIFSPGIVILALLILVTCVLLVLVFNGVI